MNNEIDIDRFVKDPSLLLELCRKVVKLISQGSEGEKVTTMDTQLREIAKTVERLEKIGVAVPDSLRGEKTRLVAELGTKKESLLALNLLVEGFDKLVKELKGRIGFTPKRVVGVKLKKRRKSSNGFQMSQTEMKKCLVDSLKELGGYAHCNDVLDIMAQKFAGKLLPGDLESDKSHGVKWRHNAHWARLDLVNDGILSNDSPRGYWQLNE